MNPDEPQQNPTVHYGKGTNIHLPRKSVFIGNHSFSLNQNDLKENKMIATANKTWVRMYWESTVMDQEQAHLVDLCRVSA